MKTPGKNNIEKTNKVIVEKSYENYILLFIGIVGIGMGIYYLSINLFVNGFLFIAISTIGIIRAIYSIIKRYIKKNKEGLDNKTKNED